MPQQSFHGQQDHLAYKLTLPMAVKLINVSSDIGVIKVMRWFAFFTIAALIWASSQPIYAMPKLLANKQLIASRHGKTPSSDTNSNVTYDEYLSRLRSKIMPAWDFPPGKFRVAMQADINADGSVNKISIESMPHSDSAENAVSSAFAQAQPLPPLPNNAGARISFIFESIYDPHGDSKSSMSAKLVPLSSGQTINHSASSTSDSKDNGAKSPHAK